MLVSLLACDPPPAPRERAGGSDDVARLHGVVVDRYEVDRLSSRTHLEEAQVDRTTGAVVGETARIEVRAEEDPRAIRATITAPKMTAHLKERTVTLSGGVLLVDDAGRRATTDALDYAAPTDDLASHGPVRIEGENFVIEGARLVGHPRGQKLRVEGPARSTVRPAR